MKVWLFAIEVDDINGSEHNLTDNMCRAAAIKTIRSAGFGHWAIIT
jgi:hypothetical protein